MVLVYPKILPVLLRKEGFDGTMKLIFESFGQKEPLDDEFSIMFPLNFVPPISLKNRPFSNRYPYIQKRYVSRRYLIAHAFSFE